jgi:hypothetical protein
MSNTVRKALREPHHWNVEGHYLNRDHKREWLVWTANHKTLEAARASKKYGTPHCRADEMHGFSELRVVAVYHEVIEDVRHADTPRGTLPVVPADALCKADFERHPCIQLVTASGKLHAVDYVPTRRPLYRIESIMGGTFNTLSELRRWARSA